MDAPLVYLLCGDMHRRVAMCGSDKPLKASKREARSKISVPRSLLEDDQVDRQPVHAP